MKKTSLLLLLLALMPWDARAFNTYDNSYDANDVLASVAMPLAVSAVCDVRGVQTDRVAELVTYMDQADVPPADFVDVFRYVPVALVMRTDNRPDFVEWVHGEVDRGVNGEALVTAMETQLRTYDNYVPAAHYRDRTRRRHVRDEYAYAYDPDYVPVTIRRHCERLVLDPLSLVEMPVAVADVVDLGLPYNRVSSLVVELNLGGIPPLQFVELMRYAPAALVPAEGYYGGGYDNGYYGQPDFVQFVRTQRIGGITGYPLVTVVDRQLQAYNIAPQIDLSPPPVYASNVYPASYYSQPVVQNWVDPVNPAYVPPVVQTRIASTVAAGRTAFSQPAPAVAAAPQVQRLLQSPNGGAVVTNPAEARRELGRGNRAQREAPIAAAPAPVPVAPAFAPGRIENRGRGAAIARRQPIMPSPAIASAPRGNGRHGPGNVAAPAPAPVMAAAPPQQRAHGRGHAAPVPMMSSAPAAPVREHGHGRAAAPAAAPTFTPAAAPAPQQHGRGHAAAAPVMVAPAPAAAPPPSVEHGHGHGGGPPAAAVAPAPAPAAAPAAGPPGQEKKKGKGKD
jgi:hypothetical protein